jgi:hypothetical protein
MAKFDMVTNIGEILHGYHLMGQQLDFKTGTAQ